MTCTVTRDDDTEMPVRDVSAGVVAVLRMPDGTHVGSAIGHANLEHHVPIQQDTKFNVGSVAKQITAHLAVLAQREGLLDLGDSVRGLLPRLKIPDMTVTDLIRHSSGVRDAESLLPLAGFRDLDHYTADDLLELAYRQESKAVPAGTFLYSNTNYLLLTKIVEAVYGSTLQQIADRLIFRPLGMDATFKEDPTQVVLGAAAAYRPAGDAWVSETRPVAVPGPGGLWCSAVDLQRWLSYLHSAWHGAGDALPWAETIEYSASDHTGFRYGPGLYAREAVNGQHDRVFHYGHEDGFSAAAIIFRSGIALACLSNHRSVRADLLASDVLSMAEAQDPTEDALRAMLVKRVGKSRPVDRLDQAADARESVDTGCHRWLGTFTCADVPGHLKLSRHGGDVYLWRRGSPDKLEPTAGLMDVFAGPGYRIRLTRGQVGSTVIAFKLDLDRAPALNYAKIGA